VPYTISADDIAMSSFGAALSPKSTHGKWCGNSAPTNLALWASLICQCALNHAIGLWVESCGGDVLFLQCIAEHLPYS
jgi:hypothetical protein